MPFTKNIQQQQNDKCLMMCHPTEPNRNKQVLLCKKRYVNSFGKTKPCHQQSVQIHTRKKIVE